MVNRMRQADSQLTSRCEMKYLELHERYQVQPWHVRLLRRLRYQPLSFVLVVGRIAWWAVCGCKTSEGRSRIGTLRLMWDIGKSEWQVRAGWWYTIEEAFPEGREYTLQTVELQTAYRWICEDCGREHFAMPIKAEFGDGEKEAAYREMNDIDDWDLLPEGWDNFEMMSIPEAVACGDCGAMFGTVDSRITED